MQQSAGTDKHKTRNTKDAGFESSTKGRNWMITINNYTKEHIETIKLLDCNHIGQEETGQSGTRHLQMILMYPNAISFKTLKTKLPTAHIELCRNKNAGVNYCVKQDTRTGPIYANIPLPSHVDTTGTVTQQSSKKSLDDQVRKIIAEQTNNFQGFENPEILKNNYLCHSIICMMSDEEIAYTQWEQQQKHCD